MEQKNLQLKLLDNPKYSSGWIENATHLIVNCAIPEEVLSNFDTEQLQLLVSVFTSAKENQEIWTTGFLNTDLNATQMQILLTGYSHGLTTEQLHPYFNPEIPYVISNWAVTALAEGFDLTKYVNAGYNKDQLYEIYAGLKDGVDISVYDNINIPAEKMAIAHHAMVLGLKVQFDENKILTI